MPLKENGGTNNPLRLDHTSSHARTQTDKLQHPSFEERVRSVTPKIFTPEGFDRKMAEDEDFRKQVTGCTTMGFDWFVKGLTFPKGIYVLPYGIDATNRYVYMTLSDQALFEIFPDVWTIETPRLDDYSFVRENRVAYTGVGEILEAIMKVLPSHPMTVKRVGTLLIDEYSGDLHELQQYLASPDKANVLKELSLTQRQNIQEFVTRARIGQDLPAIASHIQNRGGIQIIYGPPDEFIAWLNTNNIEDGDDDAAGKIAIPIPEKFLVAIVALGKYEQEALGAKK